MNLFSTGSKKKKEPAVDDHQLARPTGAGNNAPAARKSAALTKQSAPKEMDELPQLRDYPAAQ